MESTLVQDAEGNTRDIIGGVVWSDLADDGCWDISEEDMMDEQKIGKTVDYVSVNDIRVMGFNASGRTSTRRLKRLHASIQGNGILQPLLVTDSLLLVDGHRRLACARLLGLQTVPVVYTKADPKVAYREANNAASQTSGRDAIETYLADPTAVPKNYRKRIEWAERALGGTRVLAEMMAKHKKFNLGYLGMAKGIATKCYNGRADEQLATVITWGLEHQCLTTALEAMRMGLSPDAVRACIEADAELPSL